MSYVYEPYPKWIYHPDGMSKMVQSAEEHAQHEGWWESPAGPEAHLAGLAPVVAEASAPPASEEDAALRQWYKAPMKQVIAHVDRVPEDGLLELRAVEANRPGGARRAVLAAIDARMAMSAEAQAE